ncbi:hypothetical protein DPSP01_001914 [Paraphaeosphaeria sporulosa]
MAGHEHTRTPYPLLHLDMSVTSNSNGGPNRCISASPSSSVGPGDKPRYPPSAAEARDSYRVKRTADSPILNAGKRARTDGTAEPSRSNAASPATSRQNSIVATVGPSPVRRPSDMSIVDASRDPRRHGTGHAGSASSIHAASPLSMANGDSGQGSGSTTPVSGAPAPSMVSQKRVPAIGGGRGVASIRQTVLKKQIAPAVGSENVALASIQAKQIDLQKLMKNATEQIDAVQFEQRKDTAQREQAEKDLRARLSHLEQKQGKATPQQEQAESDPRLKAKLSQLEVELETEKKKRLEIEQRLKELEEKHNATQNAPADASLLKQVNELVTNMKILEAQSKSNARAKPVAQQDPAQIQSQMETRVKKSVQSDIKAHGDRIAELEKKFAAIPKNEGIPWERIDRIDQEIQPIKSQLDKLGTNNTSIMARLDAFDLDKSKDRLNKVIQEQSTMTQVFETDLDHLKDEVKIMEGSNDDRLKTLENSMKAATKGVRGESIASIKALKEDLKALQESNLVRRVSELESGLDAQKESSTKQFQKIEGDLLNRPTVSQYQSLKKQLDVSGPIKSYVDKRVEQQVPLHINPIKSALEGDIVKSTYIIKRDIGEDMAKIRQEVEQSESTLEELGSSTYASMEQLRKDIALNAAAVEGLRSEIADLDTSSALSNIEINFERVTSENSHDIERLRKDLNRLRTASGPSANQQFATKEMLEEFEGRLLKVEETAKNALKEAANAVQFTETEICDGMDTLSSQISALEKTVEAVQDDVKSLHEQPSSSADRTGSAIVSLSSLSRDNESTISVREDTRAENSAVEHRLEQLDLMLKSLTSRCDNITTDYLHQSMLQWFQQYYPHAPNFLGELDQVKAQLRRIDSIANTITLLATNPDSAQRLASLARDYDAIQQLLRERSTSGNPATSEELNSLRNRIDSEAQTRVTELKAVQAALAADRKELTDGLTSAQNTFGTYCSRVDRLEEQCGNVNRKADSFKAVVDNVESKIDDWKTKLGEVDKARELLANSVLTLHDQSASLARRMLTVESTTGEQGQTLETHQESMDDVKSAIEQQGRVQETHQELINTISSKVAVLLITCYDLQTFTRMINKNLRGGGLPKEVFDFQYPLEKPPKPWP